MSKKSSIPDGDSKEIQSTTQEAGQERFRCSFSEILAVDDPQIIENPKNNNGHPEKQIERLAQIIKFQGQRKPIVISNQSGFMVTGHATLRAIKLLGWKKIAVDFQDFENEAQEYAHMTADNAIAAWAEFDLSLVNLELPAFGPELPIEMLGIEHFKIDPSELPDYSEKNKEIKTDEFGNELKHTCPKCGFDFNE